jgi:hypothetical protein
MAKQAPLLSSAERLMPATGVDKQLPIEYPHNNVEGSRRSAVQLPVLIERIAGNGYRASGGEPLALTAEGPTREAALAKLKEQVQARLGHHAEVVPMELTPEPHPLAEFAGMFKDDPDFQKVLRTISRNRIKMNIDPKIP